MGISVVDIEFEMFFEAAPDVIEFVYLLPNFFFLLFEHLLKVLPVLLLLFLN